MLGEIELKELVQTARDAGSEDAGWWWLGEGNPPCPVSWCAVQHHALEFAGTGDLVCSRVIATGWGWTVSVDAVTMAREDLPGEVSQWQGLSVQGVETLDVSEVPSLCQALRKAARVLAGDQH